MKEYNIKRHYTTKHSSQFDKIVGQARVDKIEHLKKSIKKQQSVFTIYKKDSELVTKLSFKLCECMTESLSGTENLFKIVWKYSQDCPEKKIIWLINITFPALLSYTGQMIFLIISKKFW